MKTEQLQIKVSLHMKEMIRKRAQAANMDLSEWLLENVFPSPYREFQSLINNLVIQERLENPFIAFAELNDFLLQLCPDELVQAIQEGPQKKLSDLAFNYVAAMVEQACHKKKVMSLPLGLEEAAGVEKPYFRSSFQNLRLYLLTVSPISFRKRNIFTDSTVGDRL